ncbi:MAG: glutamyl-tRNA reductase [Deltaproteobacteria bacterium]|nr:MAG: glutamyl-tRNA reductase [Deltaproteobacteria bacterium]
MAMGAEQSIFALGLNHHTAPVEVRERLALDEPAIRRHLHMLRHRELANEALLLSTCNRVELYAVPGEGGTDALLEWVRGFRGPRGESLEPYLFRHHGRDAVRHLFRVASSLDSLVIGEPQILGQVKEAVRVADESAALGRVLNALCRRTLHVAKRVRTETDIGRKRVGVGNAGVDLALQIFGSLDGRRALLLGAGEMGTQVAHALRSGGLDELVVANRTFERAVEVASVEGGTPISWDRFDEYLARVDIVIAATGSPKPIVDLAMVRTALRKRRYRPIFLVDLSVPRNIDPRVDDLDSAYLFNVDHLRQVVDQGLASRESARDRAEEVVEREAARFLKALARIEVGPSIGVITRRAEELRQAELSRSKRLLENLDEDQREQLDALTRALVKKVLHRPLQQIHASAHEGDELRLSHLLQAFTEEDS